MPCTIGWRIRIDDRNPGAHTLRHGRLIGWPLAQLVSEWLVAGARSEVRALVDELRRDSRFGEADRKLLDRRLADAKGSPALVLAPVFVPFGVFVISSAVLLGKSFPEATKEEFEAFRLRLEAAEEFGGPSLKIREDDRYRTSSR
jgi:hypothetical protein